MNNRHSQLTASRGSACTIHLGRAWLIFPIWNNLYADLLHFFHFSSVWVWTAMLAWSMCLGVSNVLMSQLKIQFYMSLVGTKLLDRALYAIYIYIYIYICTHFQTVSFYFSPWTGLRRHICSVSNWNIKTLLHRKLLSQPAVRPSSLLFSITTSPALRVSSAHKPFSLNRQRCQLSMKEWQPYPELHWKE